ncbi:MAG: hypothetical protein HFG34_03755 [Eubacterium sp.]|nr:hypothetical protein [Eubacterium sp.]
MQRGIKMICFLLVAALITTFFAGCGKSSPEGSKADSTGKEQAKEEEDKKGGSGRFLENEVRLPEGINNIMALNRLSDGSLAALGRNKNEKKYFMLSSRDFGKNWETTAITGVAENYMPLSAITPDGSAVLAEYAVNGAVKGKLVNKKGKAKEFSFQLPRAKKENQVRQMSFDSTGNLFILDGSGTLLKVDLSSGTCSQAFDTKGAGISYFHTAGDVLTAVHSDGVMLFDTKKGSRLESEGILDDLVKKNPKLRSADTDRGSPMVFSGGQKENGLMYANENGIFHVTRGGSVAEQLVDGSLTTLSNGNIIFLNLQGFGDDHIILALNDGGTDKILHFIYDKNAASVPENELTVYALEESNVLRKVAASFRKTHPDVLVNLEFGLSGDDSVTLQDALSVLNTNILAQKGPDVLILDGMPYESYIEKGILADLSDTVAEIDQAEGIFPNMIETSKKNGKIYAMPARFLLPILEGDEKALRAGGSLNALADYVSQTKKTSSGDITPPNKGRRTLLRDLYYADSALWLTEDGSLNREALKEYLESAKKIYDVDSGRKDNDYMDKMAGDGTMEGSKIGTHNSAGLIAGKCKIAFGSMAGLYDLQQMCSTWKQTKADYCLMNQDRVKSYIPSLMAGVTEGENTELAKEFVKELLGKKAASDSDGFPVNKAAYDEICQEKMDDPRVKDGSSVSFNGPGGEKYGYEFINLRQSDIDKMTGIIEGLEKPAMTNRVIQEFVLEQGEKYLKGDQSLEEAVEAVMKKVNLYLAE